MKLHEYLKDSRNRLGLTQKEMAGKIGVSINTVQNWELGQNTPQPALWEMVIKEYSLDKELFLKKYAAIYIHHENQTPVRSDFPDFLFRCPDSIKEVELNQAECEMFEFLYAEIPTPEYFIHQHGAIETDWIKYTTRNKVTAYSWALNKCGILPSLSVSICRHLEKGEKTYDIKRVSDKELFEIAKGENLGLYTFVEEDMKYFANRESFPISKTFKNIKKACPFYKDGKNDFEYICPVEINEEGRHFVSKKRVYTDKNDEHFISVFNAEEVICIDCAPYVRIVKKDDVDYRAKLDDYIKKINEYAEDPENIEIPVFPEKGSVLYAELTEEGKKTIEWLKKTGLYPKVDE